MVKQRTSQFPGCKSAASLSSTLILMLLIIFSFVVLILLTLGILLMPGSSSGYRPKANDLASIVRNTVDRSKGDEGQKEQLVEVISWKPRAFAHHNFLKSTVVDSETGKCKYSRYGPEISQLQRCTVVAISPDQLHCKKRVPLKFPNYDLGMYLFGGSSCSCNVQRSNSGDERVLQLYS